MACSNPPFLVPFRTLRRDVQPADVYSITEIRACVICRKDHCYKDPTMLKRTYLPRHDENLMRHEGDTFRARNAYFDRGSANLRELLRRRYEWMNQFIAIA